jgi:hypothetical protein
MEGVMHVLAHGGMLPHYPTGPEETTISPRKKGVKQGVLLMLLGVLITPIFGIMSAFSGGPISDIFAFCAAITAVICFVGGPLRMLFAAIFEEGAKPKPYIGAPAYMPPVMPAAPLPPQARISALPPPAVSTQPWRARPETAEIVPPTSVPDHTTKLLEKTESEKN